jgi:hypothetical protein
MRAGQNTLWFGAHSASKGSVRKTLACAAGSNRGAALRLYACQETPDFVPRAPVESNERK